MKRADLDLYTDYLLSTFGAATATGLSAMVEGEVSHDRITRFLSAQDFTSKDLWQQVKPVVRSVESSDGVLIFDDPMRRYWGCYDSVTSVSLFRAAVRVNLKSCRAQLCLGGAERRTDCGQPSFDRNDHGPNLQDSTATSGQSRHNSRCCRGDKVIDRHGFHGAQ